MSNAVRALSRSVHRPHHSYLNPSSGLLATRIPTLSINFNFGHKPFYRPKTTSTSQSTTESVTDNVKDISRTAREEAGRTMGSVLDAVSGGKIADGFQKSGGISDSEFVSDLKGVGGVFQAVPRGAIVFGAAGVVPYLATSITTIYLARQAYNSEHGGVAKFDSETALTLLYHNENLQVAYGAVILSFLGAIHWGIEFASPSQRSGISHVSGPKGTPRYLLGVLPVVLAWPTLLLPGQLALASQWAAFTVVWYADMLATTKGWTPRWYSTYRFGLTAIVGSSIIVTLAATNFWAIDETGYSTTSRKLQAIHERGEAQIKKHKGDKTGGPKVEGTLPKGGAVKSVSGEDAFVQIKEAVVPKAQEETSRRNE